MLLLVVAIVAALIVFSIFRSAAPYVILTAAICYGVYWVKTHFGVG